MGILAIAFIFNNANSQCISGNCDNGIGIWKYKGGETLEAKFINKDYTFGKYTFPNGDFYEGDFKNAFYDGLGYLKKKNGDFSIGTFNKGVFISGYEYKDKKIIQVQPEGTTTIDITKISSAIKKQDSNNQPNVSAIKDAKDLVQQIPNNKAAEKTDHLNNMKPKN